MAVSTKADMALIQGAKDVGASMKDADTSGLDSLITTGKMAALGALGQQRKAKQEKVDTYNAFSEAAGEVELSSGALGDVLYNDTVSFAKQTKELYLTALRSGDEAGMMAAKKAMQDRSQFTQQHKAFVTDLAKLQNEGDLSSAHTKEETEYMTAVLKGNYTVERNEKGEMVFNVDGNKKTNAEFEDIYILKNYEVGKTLGELNALNKKNNTFDRNATTNALAQIVPKTIKDFRASISDDIGGGKNLPDLLNEDISLDEDILRGISGWDENGDNIVDPEEKAKLIDAIVNVNNPNFDLETSRSIMTDKLVNAVENDHTTHWEKVKKGADAAEASKVRAAKKDFDDKMAIEEYKQSQLNLRNVNARKDIILNEKIEEFSLLEASRTDAKGTNLLLKAVADSIQSNEKGGSDLKGNSKDYKIIRDGVAKEINWYRNNIDQSTDVRHLSAKEIAEEFPNANQSGAFNGTGTGEVGYYRMAKDGFDKNDKQIYVPVLINNGWQLDGNNLPNIIDYESTALKDPNQTSTGNGSLNPVADE
mgnify:CR=1 FL=1